MREIICFVFLFWAIPLSFAQLKLVQFEQIDRLQKIEKRKIIVFIYTDWCQYCHAMKSKTLKNKEIIKSLNDNFYFIDFNAEEKRTITFNNQTFHFKPTGNNIGIHELAIQLGNVNNQINYPIVCLLNEKNEIIIQYNRFLSVKNFKHFLKQIDN